MSLEKEFVPYEQSLELKELGFDETCFGFYGGLNPLGNRYEHPSHGFNHNSDIGISKTFHCTRVLYQQAFRWLYQKLDIKKGIMPLDTESQQLLLIELIDKVSSKHLLV